MGGRVKLGKCSLGWLPSVVVVGVRGMELNAWDDLTCV